MSRPDQRVILASGEEITRDEVFEAFILLAKGDSAFPLISERDKVIALAVASADLYEWAKERGIL